jgi:hypothetical protein
MIADSAKSGINLNLARRRAKLWTWNFFHLDGAMLLRNLLALFLLGSLPCLAHADAVLSQDDDTVVVHHLAHFGAGALVAIVPDYILTRYDEHSWERSWVTRMAVDCVVAAVATDIYEAETNKDTTTRVEHDVDGVLGAAVLVGASMQWNF